MPFFLTIKPCGRGEFRVAASFLERFAALAGALVLLLLLSFLREIVIRN